SHRPHHRPTALKSLGPTGLCRFKSGSGHQPNQGEAVAGRTDPAASGKARMYRHAGFCPICETAVTFASGNAWYRDNLLCPLCRSVVRERALTLALNEVAPDWRRLAIHESSPANRGISVKLRREAAGYVASQYFGFGRLEALFRHGRH
ncbi:MAG: hypothetical protein ACREFM_03055, partial [Hypericibacter sp.]